MDATKRCSKCEVKKPRSEFHKNRRKKDGLQLECKECRRARDQADYRRYKKKRWAARGRIRETRERNRAFVWEHLNCHPCVDCGESDPVVLEFDHVRGEKLACISVLQEASLERLKTEVAKCDVRCGNCHRLKTAREQEHWIYEVSKHLFERPGS